MSDDFETHNHTVREAVGPTETADDRPQLAGNPTRGVLHTSGRVAEERTFDDLSHYSDPMLREFLDELDPSHLAQALRGASKYVKRKVFKNLSLEKRRRLNSDPAQSEPIAVGLIQTRQQQILSALDSRAAAHLP